MDPQQNETNNWTQTFTISGDRLMDTVKGLLNQVSVRRIVVRKKGGDVLFDIPLYLGIASLLVFRAWAMAPIAAGLIAEYTIEVTRKGEAETEDVERTGGAEQPIVASDSPELIVESVPEPDNLTKINGIGPKVAGLLNESGIITFSQLAATSVDDLQVILDKAGSRYRIIDPATWPEQAGELVG